MNLIILAVFILLMVIYIYKKYQESKTVLDKLPPLVPGNYLVGNYFSINPRFVHLNLTEMGKSYKDLFTIRIFGQNFVVLNSIRAINELLCSRTLECAGRPKSFLLMFATNNFKDLVFSNPDELWHQSRIIFHKFFSEMKRNHNRSYFSEVVFFEQWNELYDTLSHHSTFNIDSSCFNTVNKKAINLKHIVYNMQLKIITTILFGEEVANDKHMLKNIKNLDKFAKRVISHLYEVMLNMQPLSILFGDDDEAIGNLLRSLSIQKNLMKNLFDTSNKESKGNLNTKGTSSLCDNCSKGEVSDIECNICVKSLLDVFKNILKAPKSNSLPMSNQLSEQQLMNIMTELVFAGLDTIVNTINSFFLYLTKHPKIQEAVFEELQRSKLCVIKLKNRSQFDYTSACILETLRITSHIPLGIFRRTLVDIDCFGYKLPENTILIPNLWKMHHDEELYPKPYEFQPERFLDSNKKLLKPDHVRMKNLMPFGCGKRVCPGKNVANNIIFLCVSNMLLNFKFTLVGHVDDDPRSFVLKSNLEANHYEVFVEKRSLSESSENVSLKREKFKLPKKLALEETNEILEEKQSKEKNIKENQDKKIIKFDIWKVSTRRTTAKISIKHKKRISEIRALCTDHSTLVQKILVRKPNNSENIFLAEESIETNESF